MSPSRKPFAAAAGIALGAMLAVLALPAAAPAATFCVASPSNCGGGTVQPSLQAALNAAQVNGNGKDIVRVGAAQFDDGPYVDGAGNPVTIIGEGTGQTELSAPSGSNAQTILDVAEATSQVQDLRVHVDNVAATT